MGVIHTPETAYAKEIVKHEANFTVHGPPGRPYVYRQFPTAMYKAERNPDGSVNFISVIASDEDQMRNLQSRAFGQGKKQAYDILVEQEREIATLAAARANSERTMSPAARAEAAAADAETDAHLPVIEQKPLPPKRSHKKKPIGEVVGAGRHG